MVDWPHAPKHILSEKGVYMVTAATYQKMNHFNTPERMQFLHDALIQFAENYHWELQAWAVFANHYHFIAQSPNDPESLSAFLSNLHVAAAKYVNEQDGVMSRRVWWQYWDSHITYQYSYLARLNYVHQNPVRHGLVAIATQYPWSSASWFEKTVSPAFCKTVSNFKTDKVRVIDDF